MSSPWRRIISIFIASGYAAAPAHTVYRGRRPSWGLKGRKWRPQAKIKHTGSVATCPRDSLNLTLQSLHAAWLCFVGLQWVTGCIAQCLLWRQSCSFTYWLRKCFLLRHRSSLLTERVQWPAWSCQDHVGLSAVSGSGFRFFIHLECQQLFSLWSSAVSHVYG